MDLPSPPKPEIFTHYQNFQILKNSNKVQTNPPKVSEIKNDVVNQGIKAVPNSKPNPPNKR
jgi:hypothetical protein